jgi:hypothetical protein
VQIDFRSDSMGDIRSPGLLYFKGALMLGTGILSALILLLDRPSLRTAGLLAISILGLLPGVLLCVLRDRALYRPRLSVCGPWIVSAACTAPQAGHPRQQFII